MRFDRSNDLEHHRGAPGVTLCFDAALNADKVDQRITLQEFPSEQLMQFGDSEEACALV